jgi:diamine N-acetyltransferase
MSKEAEDLCSRKEIHRGEFRLVPPTPALAEELASELARMDPWLRLGYSAQTLARYLAAREPGRHSFALMEEDDLLGCFSLRNPWLRGPLLELLAILPRAQNRGLGGRLLLWLGEWASSRAHPNLWTLTSDFNESARRFYRKHGFVETAEIPGLIRPGESELLLRKSLAPPEPAAAGPGRR